jgi:hypothetical protein
VTTARPSAVRIDDYANPRFGPEFAAIREAVVPMAATLELEAEPLLARARAETGLDDFGEPGFRARLDVLLAALRDAGLAPFGVVGNHTLVLQLLKSRLLVEDLLRRHPEIAQIPIRRPIVIVGLPRTGTTHLHNLLAADPALRSLPYWESLEPVLDPREVPPPGAPDPRRARTQAALDVIDLAMPLFERMHEMTVDHAHEEIQLLAIDFSSMLFETIALLPAWRDHYLARDQRPHYAYLKRVLQVLTWLRGGDRWVLKSPQHCEQIPALLATFPDATFVTTHRDPVPVTASMVTMITYSQRMAIDHPDPQACGAYWSARVEDLLRGCARDRDLLPDDRTVDVRFHELVADDLATVRRVYEVAGQPFTPDTRRAMADFVAAHPRGRHGAVVQDLTDFGLDPAERRAALRFYAERFGTREEPGGG